MPVDPVTQEAEPGGLPEFMISRPPWQYRESHVFCFFFLKKNKQKNSLNVERLVRGHIISERKNRFKRPTTHNSDYS